ncbi:hypothetical protein CYY_001394 [Polysphondylium violaceum]|uniref:DNA replication complex GINS protein PSF3 n=1 Tax=Polysphondylium violaceum TaxID=133409 RepID=A0A8J4Q130_9MYCE|nr:hypothetical protein CYY_001394 [Polysphondylium violaceum]
MIKPLNQEQILFKQDNLKDDNEPITNDNKSINTDNVDDNSNNNNNNNNNNSMSKSISSGKLSSSQSLSLGGKSHVKELKRLFESKKSTNSPAKPFLGFRRIKNQENDQNINNIDLNNNRSNINSNNDLHPNNDNSLTGNNSDQNYGTSSIYTCNLDNIISAADRKYYFYVNEAIRKNIPIVPSLAIRRKSIDLTHSPIKGSLYATKYQHTYSPSTRIISMTKTPKTVSAILEEQSPSPSVQQHKRQHTTDAAITDNNDSTWIKSKARDDDFINDRNISPSRLPISRSTFDLKFNRAGTTKEEPNIKFPSLSISSNDPVPPSSSSSSKTSKLKSFIRSNKDKKEEKEKDKQQPKASSTTVNDKDDQDFMQETTHHKPNKLFAWVSLRRPIKRSNTSDITTLPVKAKIDISHSGPSKPPILSTVVLDHKQKKQQQQQQQQQHSRDDSTIADHQQQQQQTQPRQLKLQEAVLSSTTPIPPSSSLLQEQQKPQKYVSLSTTILKKDLNNISPSSSPDEPRKIVSVAKAKPKQGGSSLSIGSNKNNINNNPNSLSPPLTVTPPALSAPSSPVLSPNSDGSPISSSIEQLPPLDGLVLSPSGKEKVLSPLKNNRLEAILNSSRTRSASVGHLLEPAPKFEIDEIPPLKVHCSSLEECLEVFDKPDPPHGRCYILDLGNCSLGDEGIIEISDNFPGNLEIADLSWNDITTDGIEVFCSMLRRTKSLITSLSLQGNSVSPQSIDLFLECIEQDSIEKKGYKGFGLNLKETGIENEGSDYIAQYISANKVPSIIGLNLTSSSVTDIGMNEFSNALKKAHCTLTTLILDENYLGDDGAVLLAEGLKFNRSLTHLQIKNTDIGERGTIELSNACRFNTTITLLDISLNPWQLNGEIALQSLYIFKQQQQLQHNHRQVKIVWKEDGMESNLDKDEINEIIEYFGPDKIVDILMGGIQFNPLVEKEKLFEQMTIEPKHLNKIFNNIINSTTGTDGHLNSLKLLVQLLPYHISLEKGVFITNFLSNLNSLIHLLDRKDDDKIDFLIIDLLDFFTLIIKSNNQSCFSKFLEFHLFNKSLDLMFEYPKINILHQSILNLFLSTISTPFISDYLEDVFDFDYLERIVDHLSVHYTLQPGKRFANFGHLLKLVKVLSDTCPNHTFFKIPFWQDFKQDILDKEMHVQDSFLCGFIPDKNQKLDQALLKMNYLDIDDILSEEKPITCKFLFDGYHLGMLDPGSATQDMIVGTKIDLPFWMASLLAKKQIISVEFPLEYQEKFQAQLRNEPDVVMMKKFIYYEKIGATLSSFFNDRALSFLLFKSFRERFLRIYNQSLHLRDSDITKIQINLTDSEKSIFQVGYKISMQYEDWKNRRAEVLLTSNSSSPSLSSSSTTTTSNNNTKDTILKKRKRFIADDDN